jgi:hypothetical protein
LYRNLNRVPLAKVGIQPVDSIDSSQKNACEDQQKYADRNLAGHEYIAKLGWACLAGKIAARRQDDIDTAGMDRGGQSKHYC